MKREELKPPGETKMKKHFRALRVEDSEDDAFLLREELEQVLFFAFLREASS